MGYAGKIPPPGVSVGHIVSKVSSMSAIGRLTGDF
jgi:hypothetical protein